MSDYIQPEQTRKVIEFDKVTPLLIWSVNFPVCSIFESYDFTRIPQI